MTFAELLASFRSQSVLIVGDLMLDEYIFGQATRISPEAPVMVVRQRRTHAVPGGAANVARSVAALGASVRVVGVVGDDPAAETVREALVNEGIRAELITDSDRPTTRKTRVLADSAHQVLRIDHEVDRPVSDAIAAEIGQRALAYLGEATVLLFSDYIKGALTPEMTHGLISEAAKRGIPVVANAKPSSLGYYRGADLVSLNRKETTEALGLREFDADDAMGVAERLRQLAGCRHVLTTLGERGMATESFTVPAPKVEVFDTAGAGDTVIATVALGLASVGFRSEVFALAAQTSAAVVRKVGVATPTPEDLAAIAQS